MQWLRDRWYAYVPTLLALVGAQLVPLLLLLIPALRLDPSVQVELLGRFIPVVAPISGASWCFFFVWVSWVVPWLDASNRRLRFKHTPRQYWDSLRFLIWTPAGMIGLAGFILAAVLPAYEWFNTGRAQWAVFEAWGAALIALAIGVGGGSYWYQGKVKRRFLRTLAQRQLCFGCGYDLRGNPKSKSCPECGAAITPCAA